MDAAITFLDYDRGCDLVVDALTGDLATDEGLWTATLISLFTDALAGEDDELPGGAGDSDRRGWWGDSYGVVPDDSTGSLLWLLSREKQLNAVLQRARIYAGRALEWMVEDGVARKVDTDAFVLRDGVLALVVTIYRPTGDPARLQFELFWKGL